MFEALHAYIQAKVKPYLRETVKDESGLETVEVALMIVAIAAVVIGAAQILGDAIIGVLEDMAGLLGG